MLFIDEKGIVSKWKDGQVVVIGEVDKSSHL